MVTMTQCIGEKNIMTWELLGVRIPSVGVPGVRVSESHVPST